MSTVVGAAVLELLGDAAQFKREFEAAAAGLKKVSKEFEAVGKRFTKQGEAIKKVGKGLTTWVTAPLAGIGAVSVKTAADFEAGMNKVRALSGAAGDDFAALRNQALELGRTTRYSATQAADAMGFLAMAGFDTTQILGAMPSTLELAASANIDLGTAADITTNILTGYRMEVAELAHANDVLVKAFTSANMDLQMLGESFKYAGPLAKAAGVAFEEAAAIFGLMGNAGIQASMAGTSLRGAITRLLNPTKQISAKLAELGVTVTDSSGQLLPLVDIVRQLEAAGADAGDMMVIFGQRAGPAMTAVVGQGADALEQMTEKLRDSAGVASRVAEVQLEGLRGAWIKLRSAFEGFMIAVADSGLLQWLTGLVDRLTPIVTRAAELNPALLRMGTIVAGVVAAIGPLVLAFGAVVTIIGQTILTVGAIAAKLGGLAAIVAKAGGLIGALTSPIGLVIAAVAALTAAWVLWGDKLRPVVDFIANVARAAFDLFVDVLRTAAQVVLDFTGLSALWQVFGDDVTAAVKGVAAAVGAAFGAVAEAGKVVVAALRDALFGIMGVVHQVMGALRDGAAAFREGFVVPILTALRDWVAWAYEAGSSFIRALLDGILSVIGPVVDAIVGVGGKVLGAFTRALGIDGAVSKFANAGARITKDIARGIKDSATEVTGALQDLSSDMEAAFAPNLSASINVGGGAGGGGLGALNAAAGRTANTLDEKLAHAMSRVTMDLAGMDTAVTRATPKLRSFQGATEHVTEAANTLTLNLEDAGMGAYRMTAQMLEAKNQTAATLSDVKAGFTQWREVGSLTFTSIAQAGLSVVASLGPLALVGILLSGVMEALKPVINALIMPLKIVGALFGKALAPILKALWPIIKIITIALLKFGQIIFTIAGAIREAIGHAVRAIGKAIDKIPFVSGKGIIKAGQSMIDGGKEMQQAAKEMGKEADRLKDMSFEDMMEEANADTGTGTIDEGDATEGGITLPPFDDTTVTLPPGGITLPPFDDDTGTLPPGGAGDPDASGPTPGTDLTAGFADTDSYLEEIARHTRAIAHDVGLMVVSAGLRVPEPMVPEEPGTITPTAIVDTVVDRPVLVEGGITVMVPEGEDPESFARRLSTVVRNDPRVRRALSEGLAHESRTEDLLRGRQVPI